MSDIENSQGNNEINESIEHEKLSAKEPQTQSENTQQTQNGVSQQNRPQLIVRPPQNENRFTQIAFKDYMDPQTTKILQEGLKELAIKRPENPIKFLGMYLLDNDPKK